MDSFIKNFYEYLLFDLQKLQFFSSPGEFYECLLKLMEESKEAYISALFMSTQGKSEKLCDLILKRKKNDKKTIIILDKNRAFRSDGLLDFIKQNELENLFVFYETESNKMLPYKMKEIFSVLHSKIYIFDDKILLSGANLNDAYFSNRMDRYLLIKNKELAHFLKINFFKKIAPEKFLNTKLLINNKFKPGKDTYILKFDHTEEIDILKLIFKENYMEVFLSTAYLNFTDDHIEIFKDKKIRVITSSPETSTFCYDGNLERYIVESYILSTIDTVKKLPNIDLYEYNLNDHTFHCKGLWCFHEDFVIFIIGSTNFNLRSVFRDVETNFVIVSKDLSIRKSIQTEVMHILSNSKKMTAEELNERHVSLLSRCGQYFIRKFL
ncbi:CDP-diacylglycerol--glycerol-3-phosphate 3-phosphatidyltransferase [Conglomerata obtusa]